MIANSYKYLCSIYFLCLMSALLSLCFLNANLAQAQGQQSELDTLDAYEAYLDDGHTLHQAEAHQRIDDLTAAETKRKAAQKTAAKVEAERAKKAVQAEIDVEYRELVQATQEWLITRIYTVGMTQADLFAPLGYAHRSGITQVLKKSRLLLVDTLKIMILTSTYNGTVTHPTGSISIDISRTVKTMQQCDELLAALRQIDPRPEGITWAQVSQDWGFSSRGNGRQEFKSNEIPLSFFIRMARLYGANKFECKTESGLSLRLEIN